MAANLQEIVRIQCYNTGLHSTRTMPNKITSKTRTANHRTAHHHGKRLTPLTTPVT